MIDNEDMSSRYWSRRMTRYRGVSKPASVSALHRSGPSTRRRVRRVGVYSTWEGTFPSPVQVAIDLIRISHPYRHDGADVPSIRQGRGRPGYHGPGSVNVSLLPSVSSGQFTTINIKS